MFVVRAGEVCLKERELKRLLRRRVVSLEVAMGTGAGWLTGALTLCFELESWWPKRGIVNFCLHGILYRGVSKCSSHFLHLLKQFELVLCAIKDIAIFIQDIKGKRKGKPQIEGVGLYIARFLYVLSCQSSFPAYHRGRRQ